MLSRVAWVLHALCIILSQAGINVRQNARNNNKRIIISKLKIYQLLVWMSKRVLVLKCQLSFDLLKWMQSFFLWFFLHFPFRWIRIGGLPKIGTSWCSVQPFKKFQLSCVRCRLLFYLRLRIMNSLLFMKNL